MIANQSSLCRGGRGLQAVWERLGQNAECNLKFLGLIPLLCMISVIFSQVFIETIMLTSVISSDYNGSLMLTNNNTKLNGLQVLLYPVSLRGDHEENLNSFYVAISVNHRVLI